MTDLGRRETDGNKEINFVSVFVFALCLKALNLRAFVIGNCSWDGIVVTVGTWADLISSRILTF